MKDPLEGLDEHGFITTGVSRARVPPVYEAVLDAATSRVEALRGHSRDMDRPVELYLYGSVATGMASPGRSDVDLFTIGVATDIAASLSDELSRSFVSLCRGVEVGAAQWQDYVGDGDAAYGNRLFLRHYSVPLVASDPSRREPGFRADARAARGLNGDIQRSLSRWRRAASGPSPVLARQVARKTLLAMASLAIVHYDTWTTDRASGAALWEKLHPEWAVACAELLQWSDGTPAAEGALARALSEDGIVAAVVDDFRANIGLWKGTS